MYEVPGTGGGFKRKEYTTPPGACSLYEDMTA